MIKISDKKSFFKFLDKYVEDSKARIFRGVSNNRYLLQPSIGRKMHKDGVNRLTQEDEDLIFRQFKQRSKPFLNKNYDEMNLLAIAQHHGLPTRLLDWTFNPLAAAYFAVEKSITGAEHSVIYVFDKQFNAMVNKTYTTIQVDQLDFFVPDYNDDRIINQNGIFTIHPFPWEPLNDSRIEAITIDLSFRRDLRKILNRLGVHEGTIYPGLDGIASHIRWMRTFDY